MYIITKNNIILYFSENCVYLKQNPRNKLLVGCKENEANFYGMNETVYPKFSSHNTESHQLIEVEEVPENLESNGTWVYESGEFSQNEDLTATYIRATRDTLIADTDWMLAADSPVEEEVVEQVKVYRSQLREIPQQKGFPFDVEFPVNPLVEVVEDADESVETEPEVSP